jgi:hypothetical protein
MLDCNGPAKGRGKLGFSDFVYVLGFNMRGRDEEISMEREEWERSLCKEIGTGHPGEGKRMVERASLKDMRWRTTRRWRLT